MSETRSNSSYGLSSIPFNSKSLNPLSTLHPSIVNKIKREADMYVGCAGRCCEIWAALSKNDIAGSNLTENVMEVVFKEFKEDLSSMTKVSSVSDFMKIFDQDRDGVLNADEQIQIFAFIKERLQLVANNCLQIQAYMKFQNLMKEVRLLENQITKWQGSLRQKIHYNQISKYRKEGQNKIDEFCDFFDQQFERLQKTMIHRRQSFERQAFYEAQALEERLNQPNEYLKIKPKNRLKELQYQEKLVSLQERVYEALDFRKQLNDLQIKEKDRVDRLMMEHADQQRENLRSKHQKQRKQLEIKLEQLENKLIIKMKRDFQILRKKNNLHEAQIRRLQGLEKKWATKKGLVEPELKRIKKLEKQRNEVLGEFKKTMQGSTAKFNDDPCNEGEKPSASTNKFNIKSILNSTTKFKLTNRSESDLPLNSRSMKIDNNYNAKINKYIVPKSAQKTYSLCKLYNENLREEEVKPVINHQLLEQQKSRKYMFTMSKLL